MRENTRQSEVTHIIRSYNDKLRAYRAEYTIKFGRIRMSREEFDALVAEYRLGLSALFSALDSEIDAIYDMFGDAS